MDFFAHGLWSWIIFHKNKKAKLAVLFGLLPDLISFFPFFVYNMIFRELPFGRPEINQVPEWTFTMYGIGHSLILWALIIGAIYMIYKKVPIYMFAAPIAILMDIPTHTKEFFPTPFLFPVSEWVFDGFSWGEPWFMITNYTVIIIIFAFIFFNNRKNSKRKS
ncbi:hypothetical protein ACFLZX_06365 [Nanoarchaeota archaeon]